VQWLVESWAACSDFLELGGWVLSWILFTTFVMWTFLIERFWYLRSGHRAAVADALAQWQARREHHSWYAHQIRRAIISRVNQQLFETIPMIKTLVALCPLLGLLGTVTGMVEVFDVMAIAGSGNPRAMASGVSRAILPTMAGMVAALSGFILSVQLDRRAQREAETLEDHLTMEDGPGVPRVAA
jgi:biopolymer transport protein ExbB